MLAQQILNGLIVGSVYALFSLGFTLIFGVMNIMNLAHGAIFTCGAFVGLYTILLLDLPPWIALLLAILAGGVVSAVVDYLAFRPLRARRADEFGPIVASIGAGLMLISLSQQVSDAKILGFPFETFPVVIYRFAGLRLSLLQISVVGCTVLLVGALVYFLYYTSFGRQVRAVAVNEQTARLLGINPDRIYLQIFFIAGALAGAAGLIIGLAFNSVHFLMGEPMMLRAFVVVILGGLGSIMGAVVAGLLLGIVQTLLVAYVSSQLSDAIVFSILFIALLVRPTGLFKGLRVDLKVGRQ